MSINASQMSNAIAGIRMTLKVGATVFGFSALLLLVFPEMFLNLLALDSSSMALAWAMRMIGVTLVALAGNMWLNSTNPNDNSVLRVAAVMAVSAGGLGVTTVLIPVALSWFTVVYAIVGFAFSGAYVYFFSQFFRRAG